MGLTAGFFDESTDEGTEGTCYAVAGFIGAQLVTATLEMRWRDLLDKYGLEYFKASELNAGTGQFQKFRDDPSNYNWRPFSQREKDTFREIKTAFTDLIVNSENLYGVGAVVILSDLERLQSEYKHARALPRPYFMCAQMVLVGAGTEMSDQNVNQPGDEQCFLSQSSMSMRDSAGVLNKRGMGFVKRTRSRQNTFCLRITNRRTLI